MAVVMLVSEIHSQERKHRAAEGNNTETGMREERVINLRPLNMEDFKHARNQVIT